uniref:Uncharacterized protein n=1 Tax=Anopheles epiroticus TaxID=199890 RepID=A0A182PLJ5_9DIPT
MALLALLFVSISSVAAITTTDSQVEATHTTLPVTLGETEATPDRSADLSEAETKDPSQRLEIIKQIRKVNQDGSYTVGYEAEDGTFKIESRDVLGNIKGTYGYIDANGDIKRVSYGGGQPTQTLPMVTTPPTPEEEIVHIPPRFNRTQHLLMPTTRRPPNYHPPQQQQQQHQHLHHNPPHASTLRPSVIQTIPRKRHGYSSSTTTATPPTSTASTTMAMSGGSSATTPSTTTTTTERMTSTATETGGHLAASFGEPTAASSHTSSTLHTKPGTLLIIRPTPLPYQAAKTAEQLARPERLEAAKYTHAPQPTRKPVRGNFLRRQLAPVVGAESGEQYEAQPQQLVYGQSAADGAELGSIFAGGAKPLYTTHPTPRIPTAVLAARQRAAHIQSVLQAQSQGGQPERLTTERVYVKQPARPAQPAAVIGHRHEPAPILYETSTEPSSDQSAYVTDGPASSSVVQIPAANRVLAASDADPHAEEPRRPFFRPRPIEFRPREDGSSPPPGRLRTPYGLPPPYSRPFTPLPPPGEYGGREQDDKDRDADEPQQAHLNRLLQPYRQQRRLSLPAAEPAYGSSQQQQPQNSYPVPVPYGPGGYPAAPRLPSNPYYYDIPPERPLTARDFERILQVLIFRHQQQQQASRYRLDGGYGGGFGGGYGGGFGGYNGGFPYNPYFPGPSPAPFGLGGPYLGGGGGYPQQQIPRPPLPFPYPGGPYDGAGYQNPLYSPSAPSASVRGAADGGQQDPAEGGYGATLPAAARRNGQHYQTPLDAGSAATGSLRSGDFLPPEVRESLLYRMLMLAIQAPGAGDVLPLAAPTGPSAVQGQYPLQHLQGASSMPRPQTQPDSTVTVSAAAATMLPMYSKKPVRSVQILGEE